MIGADAVPVADLDAADPAEARALLRPCCASTAWLRRMVGGRPHATLAGVTAASDRTLAALAWADVEEALTAHPRIGRRATGGDRDAAWSRQEQSATARLDDAVADGLLAGNLAYEERFGHVFLIRATGRSAEEMLAHLRERLEHDVCTEHRVVRSELAEIIRIRLGKAFS